jgi:hypothetical protein
MSDDLIKVVVDYNLATEADKENISTGAFKRIYSGEGIDLNYLPNKKNN